jgi:hypothetical protein
VSAPPLAPGATSLIEKETLVMKFHISAAAGLKSGQSDRKKNFEKANIEYRIMNIEC